MKTYKGKRLTEGCEVYVHTPDGKRYPLPLRQEIRNHSPTGFEWGYGGSGPAQLALAILADLAGPLPIPEQCPYCSSKMGDVPVCPECGYDFNEDGKWRHIQGPLIHYQDFKRDVVSQFPKEGFVITGEEIESWLTSQVPAHEYKKDYERRATKTKTNQNLYE